MGCHGNARASKAWNGVAGAEGIRRGLEHEVKVSDLVRAQKVRLGGEPLEPLHTAGRFHHAPGGFEAPTSFRTQDEGEPVPRPALRRRARAPPRPGHTRATTPEL